MADVPGDAIPSVPEAGPEAARPPAEEGLGGGHAREVSGYDEPFENAVAEDLVPTPPLTTWV